MQVSFRKTGEIWQWDRNRRLKCIGMDDAASWQVHMSSSRDDADAYVILPYRTDSGEIFVNIPNVLLQTAGTVAVYPYHVGTEEKCTQSCYTFSVHRREMPSDYVYTETELWDWQAIAQAEAERVTAECEREQRAALCVDAASAAAAEADIAAANAREAVENANEAAENANEAAENANEAAENAKEAAENVKDGYTPIKGVDYFTESDKQEIAQMAEPEIDATYSPDSENAQSGQAVAEGIYDATAWKPLVDFTLDETQAGVSAIMIEIPDWELLKTASRIRFEAEIAAGDTAIASQIFRILIADETINRYSSTLYYSSSTSVDANKTAFCGGRFEIGAYEYERSGEKCRRYTGTFNLATIHIAANATSGVRSLNDFLLLPRFADLPPYLHMLLGGDGVFSAGTRVRLEVC